jgi:Phage tail assembly chaperone protein
MTSEEKLAWSAYRQALRDIPQDFDNPEDVVFPEVPNG